MPREKKPKQRTMSQMEPADVAMAIDQWLEQTGQTVHKDDPAHLKALAQKVPFVLSRRYMGAPIIATSQVVLKHVSKGQQSVLMDRLPWVYAKMTTRDPNRQLPYCGEDGELNIRPIYLYGHIMPIIRLLVGVEKEATYFRAIQTYRQAIGFQIVFHPDYRQDYGAVCDGPWLNLF